VPEAGRSALDGRPIRPMMAAPIPAIMGG